MVRRVPAACRMSVDISLLVRTEPAWRKNSYGCSILNLMSEVYAFFRTASSWERVAALINSIILKLYFTKANRIY